MRSPSFTFLVDGVIPPMTARATGRGNELRWARPSNIVGTEIGSFRLRRSGGRPAPPTQSRLRRAMWDRSRQRSLRKLFAGQVSGDRGCGQHRRARESASRRLRLRRRGRLASRDDGSGRCSDGGDLRHAAVGFQRAYSWSRGPASRGGRNMLFFDFHGLVGRIHLEWRG